MGIKEMEGEGVEALALTFCPSTHTRLLVLRNKHNWRKLVIVNHIIVLK
jgi:hypothetical protein